MSSDNIAQGFLESIPNSLRYEFKSMDPDDAAMKISRLINKGTKVLDVGCGTGVVTAIVKNVAEVNIIGIEPDEFRVIKAKEKDLDIYQGFLNEDFLRKHGPFDYIIFADVLEHLSNPSELIILAKDGLSAGGSIIASIPNVAHWFPRTDLLRGRFDYHSCGIMDATHLRWFTRKTVKHLFERLGFTITALEYTVNIAHPGYNSRIPWKWMPLSLRRKFAGFLVRLWPTLFGCQFIIRASLSK